MPITMTESAAKEVSRYKQENQIGADVFLRIRITHGGCSGFSNKLEMDKVYDEEKDSRYNYHGVDLVVDKKSELYLDGAVINFVETLDQRGFHIDNPAAKKTCGCGNSFQV